MMPRLKSLLASPYAFLVLPPLFWSGNAVLARAAVGAVPPFTLSFWRWAIALLILLAVAWPRLVDQRHVVRRHWRLLLALAVSSVTAYNTLLYLALQTTTAINVTLVGSVMPVTIVALSWAWLGERLGPLQAVGMAVSLLGVLLVISDGRPASLLELRVRAGDGWVLLAMASWSVYSVLLRRHPVPMDPVAQITVLVLFGLPFILPLYLWEVAQGTVMPLTPGNMAVVGYAALFPGVLAYYFWNRGVAGVGAGVAGQYTYLVPILTALLSTLFLGETVRWFHLVALAFIFSGIALANRRPKR